MSLGRDPTTEAESQRTEQPVPEEEQEHGGNGDGHKRDAPQHESGAYPRDSAVKTEAITRILLDRRLGRLCRGLPSQQSGHQGVGELAQ